MRNNAECGLLAPIRKIPAARLIPVMPYQPALTPTHYQRPPEEWKETLAQREILRPESLARSELVPPPGERGGDIGVDGEVAMQAGRSQELRDRRAGGGEEHLAAEQPGATFRADQDGQPRLVAGRNAGQVDDERAGAAVKHVDQAFPQFLGRGEVERTAQPDDAAAGPDGSRAA